MTLRARPLAVLLAAAALLAPPGPRSAGDGGADAPLLVSVPVPADGLVDQDLHPTEVACGPASLLNALLCEGERGRAAFDRLPGDDARAKLARLVESSGAEPSVVYEGQPRWHARSGVANLDLVGWARDLRAGLELEAVEGLWLDRTRGEDELGHLQRVHGALAASLADGAPVVVKLRSWAPGPRPEGAGHVWNGIAGHWVLVTAVPASLPAHARGFAFSYVDPATGALHEGYASCERQRAFNAAKGDEVNWRWVGDRSFLVVTAPDCASLGLGALDWQVRSNVTLDFAIGAW